MLRQRRETRNSRARRGRTAAPGRPARRAWPTVAVPAWPRRRRWSAYGAVGLVLLLVAVPGRRRRGGPAARSRRPTATSQVPGLAGAGRGAARRPRHPAALRRHRRRPVLRAGLRAGAGPVLRDGLPPPRHGRPALGAVRRADARDRQVRSAPWAGAGSPSGSCACSAPRPAGLPRGLQRRRQRLPRTSTVAVGALARVHRARRSAGSTTQPEQWTPVDSLAWLKAMAWDLRGNMDDEIERGADVGAPDRRARSPSSTRRTPTTGTRRSSTRARWSTASSSRTPPAAAPASRPGRRWTRRRERALRQVDRTLHGDAADARLGDAATASAPTPGWSTATTPTTGKPLLANDPHLGVSMPGIWYQMGLHCTTVGADCPFDVAGFTFSGLPGRGDRPQRRHRLGVHQPRPRRHRPLPRAGHRQDLPATTAGSRPLRMRDETIQVPGGTSRSGSRSASTRHGPLLSDVSADLAASGPTRRRRRRARPRATGTPSRWRGPRSRPAAPPTRSSSSTRPPTGASSARRPRTSPCPAQNLVYADRAGHIGYQAPGRIPIRQVRQRRRLPGAGLAAGRTTGPATTCRSTRCPTCSTPTTGFVVTANQAVDRAGLPLPPQRLLGPRLPQPADPRPARSDRTPRLDVADMARHPARHPQPDGAGAGALPARRSSCRSATTRRRPAAAARLGLHPARRLARAAAYFNVVWRNLLALTFHDELPEYALARRRRPLVRGRAPAARRARHAVVGRRRPPTTSVETRDDILREAMTRRPRRADPPAGPRRRRLDLGPPAPARPARTRRLGESGIGAGRVAVQPRRLRGRRRRRDRGRDLLGRRADGLRRRRRARRCGWWSPSPTSTTPAGST